MAPALADGLISLKPFQPAHGLSVAASASVRGGEIVFHYRLSDPESVVLDGPLPGHHAAFTRADELWKTTCFEAFWSSAGSRSYYELNLSPLSPRWNLYAFDDYRKPQPPRASADFELVSLVATEDSLEAILRGREMSAIDLSLNAVIRTRAETHYFALVHPAPKADFHDRRAFTLSLRS